MACVVTAHVQARAKLVRPQKKVKALTEPAGPLRSTAILTMNALKEPAMVPAGVKNTTESRAA
jgi:hypothetical protein